jgi:hypothetical protein
MTGGEAHAIALSQTYPGVYTVASGGQRGAAMMSPRRAWQAR